MRVRESGELKKLIPRYWANSFGGFYMINKKLWVMVLTHKYLKNHFVLDAVCPPVSSPIWNAICKIAHILQDGFQIRIADGSSSLWFDKWTRDGPLRNFVDYVHISDSHLLVKDCWHHEAWNFDSLCISYNDNVHNLIEEVIVPIHSELVDCWAWFPSPSGAYSTLLAYKSLIDGHLSLGLFS